MMTITLLDYGTGNLHSLAKALAHDGTRVRTCDDAGTAVRDTDLLVLPGVGAFSTAAARLAGDGRLAVRAAVRDGLPVLGICLGMQLLFDGSEEGAGEGLGIIPGRVTALRARRLPQIGWNILQDPSEPALGTLRYVYYANSFACRPDDPACVRAWSTHEEDRFPAIVRSGSVLGVQFHPEKSSLEGIRFLRTVVSATGVNA